MRHRIVATNGVRVHCVEEGEGPLVLLVHGFPESWYSWRHQIPAIAAAGFRAVAIDVRGYGRSSCPVAVEDFRMMKMVGDIVGLLPALGASSACLIGHDWGAPIVWNSALLRPDLFWGVAGLSVPYTPRGDVAPLPAMRQRFGEAKEFYVDYFQQPGRAEAEIEEDVRRWLLGFYWSASGDVPPPAPNIALLTRGAKMCDRLPVSRRAAGLAHRRRPRLSTPASSSAPASPAGSTATATSIATGRTSPRSPAPRSRCPRCSSAAIAMGRRCGAGRRSSASRRHCRAYGARRSCPDAATGSSRSVPKRPTAC